MQHSVCRLGSHTGLTLGAGHQTYILPYFSEEKFCPYGGGLEPRDPPLDRVKFHYSRVFSHPGEQPSVEDPAGEYPHVVIKSGGGKALVVQDYAFGKYLGYLKVAFDNNGQVKNWTGNPILLDSSVPKGKFDKVPFTLSS